ncbi:hypothetical protein CLV63_10864 [Murinocardiopsis flavida]|uniref:Uncharacterized protein n=1 Tax=Murinocardiopsis flavida TaxID=645275 RepID=A0A2P8DJE4_9ACTN|nr:hypothetical protein [Murinocardiopsis flavida]PSK97346.1 hypothetical protein CLV63_10864 [Murinocardiopsis flavida]
MSASPGKPEQRDEIPAEPHTAIRGMSLWPPPRSTRHSGKRRKGVLIAIAAVLVVLAGGAAAAWVLNPGDEPGPVGDGVPAAFAGSRVGEMAQVDEQGKPVTDWTAAVDLKEGAHRGSAEWRTFNCRGSLTLTEKDGARLSFDYVETYDPDNRCVDEATLTLAAGSGDAVEAEWLAESHDGTMMTSTGALD